MYLENGTIDLVTPHLPVINNAHFVDATLGEYVV
jgi:hypothetical protein